MGMFDYVKCSSNIGEQTNVECQTKDIDSYEGGTMSFYWVDPSGRLWTTDYTGCSSIDYTVGTTEPWKRIKYVPTGVHGRSYTLDISREIEIYNTVSHPDGYVETTYCQLLFVRGSLEYFEYINNV